MSISLTLDTTLSYNFDVFVSDDTAVTLMGGTDGQAITIVFQQDGTGHAVTANNFTIGTVSTAAGAVTAFSFRYASSSGWQQLTGGSGGGGSIGGTTSSPNLPYTSAGDTLSDTGFAYSTPSSVPTLAAVTGTITQTIGGDSGAIGFVIADSSNGDEAIVLLEGGAAIVGLQDASGSSSVSSTGSMFSDVSTGSEIAIDATVPSIAINNGSTFTIDVDDSVPEIDISNSATGAHATLSLATTGTIAESDLRDGNGAFSTNTVSSGNVLLQNQDSTGAEFQISLNGNAGLNLLVPGSPFSGGLTFDATSDLTDVILEIGDNIENYLQANVLGGVPSLQLIPADPSTGSQLLPNQLTVGPTAGYPKIVVDSTSEDITITGSVSYTKISTTSSQIGGHVCAGNDPATANPDFAGIVGLSSETSHAVTFINNFTGVNAPLVVLTPLGDPTATGTYWITYTGATSAWTGFTVNVSISGTISFNYVVIGSIS